MRVLKNNIRTGLVLCCLAACFCTSKNAFAQTPPSAQSGQVIQKFKTLFPLKFFKNRNLTPRIEKEPAVVVEAGPIFVLQKVIVGGVTVYTDAEIQAQVSEYIGKDIGFNGLRVIARELTAQYRRDGYILSRVVLSPQKITDGIVQFTAVEGFVSHVRMEGYTQGQEDFLSSIARRIKDMRPLHVSHLERALLLLNDIPGIDVRTVFRASDTVEGTSELVLMVKQKKWDASVTVDNRGSRFLGPWQVSGTAALNRGLGRTTVRSVVSAPVDELQFFDVSHERLIGTHGLKAEVRAALSLITPGGDIAALDIAGSSQLYEGKISYPVRREQRRNITAYASAHILNASGDLLGVLDNKDHVRSVRMGAAFDWIDQNNGMTFLDVHMRQGMNALGATDNGAGRSRVNGSHEFTSFRGALTRFQPLPGKFSMVLSAQGQYAMNALLASEEIAWGGAGFGRGYDAAEITGDHGAAAAIELRYTRDVPWTWAKTSQFYSFYDIGAVWNRDRVALDAKKESLSSVGGGVRLTFVDGVEASIEAALPLTRPVAAGRADDGMRMFFRLAKRFSPE